MGLPGLGRNRSQRRPLDRGELLGLGARLLLHPLLMLRPTGNTADTVVVPEFERPVGWGRHRPTDGGCFGLRDEGLRRCKLDLARTRRRRAAADRGPQSGIIRALSATPPALIAR